MTDPGGFAAIPRRAAVARTIGFFILWIILSGGAGAALLPGIAAAPAAAWFSLRLLPPGRNRLAPFAFGAWVLRFLGQSLVAGADVARRACDPSLPLDPGFVAYSPGLAPGPTRNLFTSLTSLLPGTVPVGTGGNEALEIHALDRRQPVAAQLAAEEARLRRAIGRKADDG